MLVSKDFSYIGYFILKIVSARIRPICVQGNMYWLTLNSSVNLLKNLQIINPAWVNITNQFTLSTACCFNLTPDLSMTAIKVSS